MIFTTQINPTCSTYVLRRLQGYSDGIHFLIFLLKISRDSESFTSFGKMSHIFGAKKQIFSVPYLTEFTLCIYAMLHLTEQDSKVKRKLLAIPETGSALRHQQHSMSMVLATRFIFDSLRHFITKYDRYYCKMWQKFITKQKLITKCVRFFITKCNSFSTKCNMLLFTFIRTISKTQFFLFYQISIC